jgi:hypothetical protein
MKPRSASVVRTWRSSTWRISPRRIALLPLLCAILVVAGCDAEPSLQERIVGSWKNGDGNIIRFEEGEKAAVGQEGLAGEGPCRYELRSDTISVTMPSAGDPDVYVVYNMRLAGDTLRILTLERHEGGASMRLTVGEFAEQIGRPLYKLDFLRMEAKTEEKK